LPPSTATVDEVPRLLHHTVLTLLTALVVMPGLTAVTASGASAAPAPSVSADSDPLVHPEWGRTWADNAKIKRSCHQYAYGYAITPPEGDWALETFLVGPRGKAAGSGYFVTGKDGFTGTSTWRLCKRSTKGGLYTIRAMLSVQNGSDIVEGWLPDSTFRLRKPR
jgi:hypothetical protein